jgi:putative transposase
LDIRLASPGQRSGSYHCRYDADHLCVKIAEIGADIVIPAKRNRKLQRSYDAVFYRERNRIERLFSKLKQFRRVATRYDKLLANFMGFVKKP